MQTNENAIRLIVASIAVMAILCVLTICTLSSLGIQIPPELNNITSGLLGSLAGMLVKTTPSQTTVGK